MVSANQQSALLLPKLKDDCDVRSGKPGEWDYQQPAAFNNIASSLDYRAPGETKSVSSVPTIWARPLSVEMALHNDAYPIREQIIPLWQGLLAAIALAEVRGFPLQAKLLQLAEKRSHHAFARSAWELLPDATNALYLLKDKEPWEDIYLFSWSGQPVGMTSPSTLVVPSEEGKWTGLPWWNGKHLQAPHRYLNDTEKVQLASWLDHLGKEVRNHSGALRDAKGNSKPIDRIIGLINSYIVSLGARVEQNVKLSDSAAFFGDEINRGSLMALNRPVKAESQESNVRLVGSLDKSGALPLLIIDAEIARYWNEPSPSIWVFKDRNLASLRPEDIKSWQESRQVICLESRDLFLPELGFIDKEAIFPGGLLPEGATTLTFNGNRITPLIPLNPILLNYFTPEDLIKRLKFSVVGNQVQLAIDLPLSGVQGSKAPQNYRVTKSYPLKEENALEEVPVLEVWPNFRTEGWKEYYGFYYDAEFGQETFKVNFPDAQEIHEFKEKEGSYQLVRLEQFPPYIECKDVYQTLLGLILLPTPELKSQGDSWIVGVDFGTSFTNVYVNKNERLIERLALENLHRKVTDIPIDTRFPVLFEFFIPESFVPADKPFPMSTVLTNRGAKITNSGEARAVFDGRLYVPEICASFKPQESWIKTNLKWLTENRVYNQLFVKHLALHISAIAAKNNVSTIQWSLSFPSAFSIKDRNQYAKDWRQVTRNLTKQTGIVHNCPESDQENYFRTESLAVAQYFADYEGHDLVSTTCVDMGGGTSDISIWQDNQLLHQCSVQLAGSHLFSQFIELNPNFLSRLGIDPQGWKQLRGPAFYAKLDVWMRLDANQWLEDKRDLFDEEKDFQGLTRLMAIGVSGLYFYIGTILKGLHKEGKYTTREITPVYVGGNGSRFLHWLSEGGEFRRTSEINELLSEILSIASDFPNTQEPTRLSQYPKDEVACGLVLQSTKLKGLEKREKDPVFVGEECSINSESFLWDSRLEIKSTKIEQIAISGLSRLRLFLDVYHDILNRLSIRTVTPLEGYRLKENQFDPEADYNKKLWRDTERELRNSINNLQGIAIDDFREEPPFILGLKALLRVLGKEWAGKS